MDYNVVINGIYKTPTPIEIKKESYTFLQDYLFGLPSKGTHEDFLAMDYRKIGVQLSTPAQKGDDPTRVNHGTPFNEKLIYGAYFNDEDEVNPQIAENRVFGEPLDKPFSPEQRLIFHMAEKRDEIRRSQYASREKACADVLKTGKFSTKNGEQSFPITASLLSQSGANLLTKPVETLAAAAKAVRAAGGGNPKLLIMNTDDAVNLMNSAPMQKLMDVRRIDAGFVRFTQIEDNGLSFCGTLNLPGCGTVAIYSYEGMYEDNGTAVYYIPQGTALFVPEKVGFMGFCGVYADTAMGASAQIAAEFGEHYWTKDEALPHTLHIQVQSCPCPMVTAIDKYAVITNIPASA